jgi:hypothetical protein
MSSNRGDTERDHAALEAEIAHEHRRRAEHSESNIERDRLLEVAGLHAEAAQLYARLARVYDRLAQLAG